MTRPAPFPVGRLECSPVPNIPATAHSALNEPALVPPHPTPAAPGPVQEAGPPPAWILQPSSIHGLGLFARTHIPAGHRIIEYVGRKVSKTQSLELCRQQNPYVFYLDEVWDLDGDVPWNPARFINHSCQPNCEALDAENGIWIVAHRAIPAGEELTYNYGYDLDDYHEHPCRCGAPGCLGYMVAEEFHPLLAQRQSYQNPAPSTSPAQPPTTLPLAPCP